MGFEYRWEFLPNQESSNLPGYSRMLWDALGCSGMLWDALGCSGMLEIASEKQEEDEEEEEEEAAVAMLIN